MAKKFIYRLETLLNLKSFKVKEIEESIQKVLYYKLQTEIELRKNEEYLAELNSPRDGYYKAIEIQALNYHKDFIKEEINELKNELARIIEIENLLRARLTDAMKEEKVLQKLKERQYEEYVVSINREENKLLDELSIQKEVRNKNTEQE